MLRTCNKCGRVAFAISRAHALKEIKRFNKYFESLTRKQQREDYGGKKSSIKEYDRCGFCGNGCNDFRASSAGDCPSGCTLSPIIYERRKRKI
jgi:hypothetical protein